MTESKIDLPALLKGLHSTLLHELNLSNTALSHPTTKGDVSENLWLKLLNNYLPQRYQCRKAHIVDSHGNQSDQIDIVIHDIQYSPFIFKFEGADYMPAESVYAVFEVKQTLNKQHLEYAQKKVKSVTDLHRTSKDVPTVDGPKKAVTPKPIIGGLLCVHSDWTPSFGQPFNDAIAKADLLDMVCVASSGLSVKDKEGWSIIQKEQTLPLFLFRLISILQEKATVPMVDMSAYEQWIR